MHHVVNPVAVVCLTGVEVHFPLYIMTTIVTPLSNVLQVFRPDHSTPPVPLVVHPLALVLPSQFFQGLVASSTVLINHSA
jgi:hypothetical protein